MTTNNTRELSRFIDYLDNYKDKHIVQEEYVNIIQNINKNYLKYNNTNFVGIKALNRGHVGLRKKVSLSDLILWNTTNNSDNFDPLKPLYSTSLEQPTNYNIWISNHEANITLTGRNNPFGSIYSSETCKSDASVEKAEPSPLIVENNVEYVEINAKINDLADLIDIIEKYEYKSNTDYNIDLKSLHNIKDELIQMNSMIGMQSLKTSILDQLLYFVQNLHIGKENDFKHTVIYGPPGTGKTEIAKIIGNMYSKLGILKNNVFKKVTRNDLIAGYLGQTALKTKKVINECLGGCLFIDEVYSLASHDMNDSYSKECIDTLCESLSDHKDELMVIIAGYEQEVNDTFFKVNKGLDSRFIWRFKVNEYTPHELMQIFKKKVSVNEWILECDDKQLDKWFNNYKGCFPNFGRDIELLFSYTKISHGRRIYGKSCDLRKKIIFEDLENGYNTFLKNTKKKDETDFHGLYI